MNVIIFGPPGVGKGTQSKRIQEAYGLCHVSTGDILRREIAKKSRTGLQAEQHVTRGEMVPDELIIRLVKRRLASDAQCQRNGWLLDGFPRTLAQARSLSDAGLVPDDHEPIDPDELLAGANYPYRLGFIRILDTADGVEARSETCSKGEVWLGPPR